MSTPYAFQFPSDNYTRAQAINYVTYHGHVAHKIRNRDGLIEITVQPDLELGQAAKTVPVLEGQGVSMTLATPRPVVAPTAVATTMPMAQAANPDQARPVAILPGGVSARRRGTIAA